MNYKKIYKNTDYEKYFSSSENPLTRVAKTEGELLNTLLRSKMWRLNNLYKVVDKNSQLVKFVMNESQHKVFAAVTQHPRIIILKSRQQGISTFFLLSFFDDAIFNENMNIGLMAQGKDEAGALLARTKRLWEELPDFVKTGLKLKEVNDNKFELSLSNNSIIRVRTSFRGGTLNRLHISEFGKIAKENAKLADETVSGTLQAISGKDRQNIVVIESTAEGNNMFKDMWDKAVETEKSLGSLGDKDFKPIFLPWHEDRDCLSDKAETPEREDDLYFKDLESRIGKKLTKRQKNYYIQQKREIPAHIKREYPGTVADAFAELKDPTYYASYYIKHVKERGAEKTNLYKKGYPVHVAFDLGMDDLTCIIFYQKIDGKWYVLKDYKNSQQGIKFYCTHITQVMAAKGWTFGTAVLPHDANTREYGTGYSRELSFHQNGIRRTYVVPRTSSLANDIDQVRVQIKNVWLDPVEAAYVRECLLNYQADVEVRTRLIKASPKKSAMNHGADAFRYMILGQVNNSLPHQQYRRPVGLRV